jgi:flavin reductase (DIM6/NTAB) family NADH-FMN oxidoreductase RutF
VAIGEDDFKSCLAAWASGVTIITSCSGEQVHGMTVSDFSGASLSPPLVTICCSRESTTTGLIAEGRCFAVNILADGQQELSNRFASKKLEKVRFEGVDYTTTITGAPLLAGALAHLDCRLVATHEAGDHLIYIGQVEASAVYEGEPLLYHGGAYGRFTSEDGA